MNNKRNERLTNIALKKIRDLNNNDIKNILKEIDKNKTEIEKLKAKKGLCPQSLII